MSTKFWKGVVFMLSAGGYVPLAIGGYQHPIEINVAAYGLWLILSAMLTYSAWAQHFDGWVMQGGYAVGNLFMLILASALGGFTFNLGMAEWIVLYGIVTTLSVWGAKGQLSGTWNPQILFAGGVVADVMSFWPQFKQYWEPHEAPTWWLMAGWGLFVLGAIINLTCVERALQKLASKERSPWEVLWESAFTIENGILMVVTICVMWP